jgi:hypothetical protein
MAMGFTLARLHQSTTSLGHGAWSIGTQEAMFVIWFIDGDFNTQTSKSVMRSAGISLLPFAQSIQCAVRMSSL